MSQAARALVIAALAAAAALASGSAYAEPKQVQATPPRPWTGYKRTPGAARDSGPLSAVSSRLVYLKRCTTGCTVHFATVDDSRTGASRVPAEGTHTLSPFSQPQAVWDELLACVRTTFAPFDIQIIDTKPLDNTTPYFLNLVGGKPTELDPELAGAGGVAPFDCGEIPNAITYTFDVYGPDALALCWTASQEIAHAFGLEHELLQKDPMTYLAGDEPKRFRDADAPCGEYEAQSRCQCGGKLTQNSYRHIVGMFGPGAPTPPELTIKNPVEGKPTQPGFTAIAVAIDEVRVEKVELYIDGTLVSEATTPYGDAFELATSDVGAGEHALEIKAIDVQGVAATKTLTFTQGPPCTASTVCKGDDVCVRGVCVAGPDTPGGLGAICQQDVECLSHRCANAGEEHKHCVDECDLGNDASCPDEFACVSAGAEGVCWPAPSGGCCDAGSGPQGPILLALGLGVLVLRRRRATPSA